MRKKEKSGALGGAAILALSNIVCRILGFLFKIPLSNLIGSEGMGYFSLANQVFGVATVASSSGMPVVLTRLTAERNVFGKPTLPLVRSVSPLFLSTGFIFSAVMAVSAGAVCTLAGTEAAGPAVVALSPAVFFVTAETMYRAYFQGKAELGAGAAAQLAEAVCKLVVGTGAAWYLYTNGYDASAVAAGAAFGVMLGTAAAALVLRLRIFREGRVRAFPKEPGLAHALFNQSLPITAGSAAMGLLGALDAMVILNRLGDIGYSVREAASLYGIYTGYAVTVYALPFALTGAVTAWVAPAVAGAFSSGNGEKLAASLHTAVKTVCCVAFPAALCYLLMPRELLSIFFSRSEAELAAPLLSVLAVSAVLCPLGSVASAALQAMGKPKIPVISGIAAGVLKLAANYILIGIPEIGINGAPISAALSFVLSLLCCGVGCASEVKKLGGGTVRAGRAMAMPAACGLIGAFSAQQLTTALSSGMSERVAALGGILIGFAVYAALVWLTGVVTHRELSLFGLGKKHRETD